MQKYCISQKDEAVLHLMNKDKRLAKLISYIGDIECNVHSDSYAFIISEIVGQMLSNKVAKVINSRLLDLCDGTISIDKVSRLSFDQLKTIGLSKAKCEYIIEFSKAVNEGTLNLSGLHLLPDDKVIYELTRIRGIGTWTAKMYLLFVLQRSDVLPIEDVAFLQGYKWLYSTDDVSKDSVIKKCKKWKPYSSIAARYLYRAVDTGLIKSQFHLYKDIGV